MSPSCKHCHQQDKAENMHLDIFTGEFYHESCRPHARRPEIEPVRTTGIKRGKAKR